MDIKQFFSERKKIRRFTIDERLANLSEATNQPRDPNATKVAIATPRVGGGSAGQFEDSPVDLSEIGRAYYSDSYIMRAVNKISGLMFKSGWSFVSLNSDALDYIQTRFLLMEESTGTSTEEILREAGLNFVLYGNASFLKSRGSENLADIEATGYYGGEPINALFSVPPERLQISRDEFGNIETYNIMEESGSGLEVSPDDFLHMTYHKPTGRAFGVPHISAVIDDVLILRQIEENIARMIYRNIFPLQTYTVGLPQAGYEATDEEILEIQGMIENAPLDSILVLPERHKIETVSSSNGALQAYDYLKYFRQRVFTGLGVSESTMGIGDSSNRSTSDNQSSDLIDLVKEFQIHFASEFQKIVNELLFEGGFDPTLNKEDRVVFEFTEIEQAAKIARENHELNKFLSNGQSFDEYREHIGAEPMEDLSRMYANLFKGESSVQGAVNNQNQPENQHGKADAPTKDSLKDSRNSNKFTKIVNSQLTEQSLMVNLSLDDVEIASTTESLLTFWSTAKKQLTEKSDLDKERIQTVLSHALPEGVFETDDERSKFVESLTASLTFKLKEGSLKEDGLYLYERAVLVCYTHIRSTKQRGGTK